MAPMLIYIVWVLIGAVQFEGVVSFLFPPPAAFSPCPAMSPCYCSGTTLSCSGKHLSTIPQFKTVTVYVTQATITLSNNQLTSVSADAFQSITFGGNASLTISFYNNALISIESGAFRGVEYDVSRIVLDNNQLTSIPAEIGRVASLRDLSLYGNPITTLSTSAGALQSIGPYLVELDMDFSHFTSWSPELSYLTRFIVLRMKHFNLSPTAENALVNMGPRLTNLFITDSTLDHIPDSVCSLPALFKLEMTNNRIGHMTSIIFSCTAHSLNQVKLEHNGITSIPNDITTSSSQIETIWLSHNSLTSFPRVLNVLKRLSSIHIAYNSITSLQRADLGGLTSLSGLYIDHNPISYVSADAFADNVGLESLSLTNTQVRIVPSSLVPLPKFRLLYLSQTQIECSCAAMRYLKPFRSWRYQIKGTCASTGTNIDTYVGGDLQRCP